MKRINPSKNLYEKSEQLCQHQRMNINVMEIIFSEKSKMQPRREKILIETLSLVLSLLSSRSFLIEDPRLSVRRLYKNDEPTLLILILQTVCQQVFPFPLSSLY